jgi:hypothetical protein
MARIQKSALSFDALTLEGSLLSPAKLATVAERKAAEQSDADYLIPKGLTLRDETARYFRIGQALFRELHASRTPSLEATIRFAEQMLHDVFEFAPVERVTARERDGRTFPLALELLGGRVPVVVVPPADPLDRVSTSLSRDRRRSAASALQDWLNADEASLWGLATNGECLRLLRDNESLTRPAYLEADLRQIFEGEDFAGFSALWLTIHATRFGRPGTPPTDCALERWRESGGKEGLAARDRLRDGVENALLALGNGFLQHAENASLATRLRDGSLTLDKYFGELLRLVYRLIFLLTAEDRDLLHPPGTSADVRKLYGEGYSLSLLRDRAVRRSGWNSYHDRWEGLRITLRALADGEPRLGLPALGGLFASTQTPELDNSKLSNSALMEAIFRLAWLRADGLLMPVNWRDMETEELGSVYESLLELTPRLSPDGREFRFAEGIQTKGNARKTSGSYYTPDSLVQALLDTALDPVLDRVESEASNPSAALLGVTVIDPACGSGHFLLAAARRIATRVVKYRADGVATPADYRHALRDVVRSCIHGVDRNPMAVELTRVALWIETVEPGRPLGFLDANIRLGDSLLGIFSMEALEAGIPDAAYKPLTSDDKVIAKECLKKNKADKGERTGVLDFSGAAAKPFALPPLAASLRAVRSLPEETVDQINLKRERFDSATHDPLMHRLHEAADLYIAAFLTPKTEASAGHGGDSARIPTTADVWNKAAGHQVFGPRLGHATQLARAARAFHWPLEFADVMNSGGFDIVLGNPPWERIKLQEQEFFASREPEIAQAPNAAARGRLIKALRDSEPGTRERALYQEFETSKRIAEASSEFARLSGEDSGRFPLTGKGDVNTYALFAELFTDLNGSRGRAGIIVPTGIATDATTAPFFSDLISRRRLIALHDFQTGLGFFDDIGHARFKFSLLTICAAGLGPHAPEFSFFSRTAEEFKDPQRRFTLTAEEIAHINPNTKTAPLFRTRFDAELTAKIYSRVPVLINEGQGLAGNPWKLSFMAMFHMSNDSHLFRTCEQLRENGYVREGADWALALPQSHLLHTAQPGHLGLYDGATASPKRYVPLYEAKMIHLYDHRWATYEGDDGRDVTESEKTDPNFIPEPRYWIPLSERQAAVRELSWTHSWLLGFRNVCRATDERSLIAATFPLVGVGHSMPLLFSKLPVAEIACFSALLSSLVFDYVVRQKLGGINLTFHVFQQLPALQPTFVPKGDDKFIVPRVIKLTYTSHSMAPFARDLGYDGAPYPWDEDGRAVLRAELDAWFARAYGLTRDELRYILDPADVMGPDYPSETFRVLRSNEIRKHGEYRTQRLVLDAWDRMERGELPKPEPYQKPPVAPAASQPSSTIAPACAANPRRDAADAQPAFAFHTPDKGAK